LALFGYTEYLLNGWYGDQSIENEYGPKCNYIIFWTKKNSQTECHKIATQSCI
jgi:hypothetical protein